MNNEFNIKTKFGLFELINNKTKQEYPDESFYKTKKVCYLPKIIKNGEPIRWLYENGETCTGLPIESYEKDDYGIWIHTKNKSYHFRNLYDDGDGKYGIIVASMKSDESLYEI